MNREQKHKLNKIKKLTGFENFIIGYDNGDYYEPGCCYNIDDVFKVGDYEIKFEDALSILDKFELKEIPSKNGEMKLYLPKENNCSYLHYKSNEGIEFGGEANKHSLYLIGYPSKEIISAAKDIVHILDKDYSSLMSRMISGLAGAAKHRIFQKGNQRNDYFQSHLSEDFRYTILRKIEPKSPLNLSKAREISSLDLARDKELVELEVFPIEPFKNPNSTFTEEGTISGLMRGKHNYGIIRGQPHSFSGSFSGSYKGGGEIQAIDNASPIIYLCKDKSDKSILVNNTMSDLEIITPGLENTIQHWRTEDMNKKFFNDLYEKFGPKNSEKTYMQLFNAKAKKHPVSVIGTVQKVNDINYFHLSGIKDLETGETIKIRDYVVGELCDKFDQILTHINYNRG
jgi:hypothetical protein